MTLSYIYRQSIAQLSTYHTPQPHTSHHTPHTSHPTPHTSHLIPVFTFSTINVPFIAPSQSYCCLSSPIMVPSVVNSDVNPVGPTVINSIVQQDSSSPMKKNIPIILTIKPSTIMISYINNECKWLCLYDRYGNKISEMPNIGLIVLAVRPTYFITQQGDWIATYNDQCQCIGQMLPLKFKLRRVSAHTFTTIEGPWMRVYDRQCNRLHQRAIRRVRHRGMLRQLHAVNK